MATSKDTVEDILERLGPLDVRARAMFGEYALYCDDKVVALICDDRVFLKPTAASDDEGLELAPPYEGAKDHRVLGERLMGEEARFQSLVQATADLLPKPKPKKKKAARKPARKKKA